MGKSIELSWPQLEVYRARTPLVLDMAGQGSGKTANIGIQTIEVILKAPECKGFIAANTYNQLSQSTLTNVFAVWKEFKGWKEFDKENPTGCYVVDKKPPAHFKKFHKLKRYNNTISFDNGCLIFTGSLDNYKAHDGKEFTWAHLDETKDTEGAALKEVIISRLRQVGLYYDAENNLQYEADQDAAVAKGWKAFNPLYIHTSPGTGNMDWLLEMFALNVGDRPKEIQETLLNENDYFLLKTDVTTAVIYQTFHNKKNLPPGWIDTRLKSMTRDEALMFIYSYPFSRTGNEYYNEFNVRRHVVKTIPVRFDDMIYLSYDFNVMPYVTQIAVQIDNVVRYYNEETREKIDFLEPHHTGFKAMNVMRFKIVKEFCMRPPDNLSERAAETVGQWYTMNGGKQGARIYGDAEGHSRIRGLGALTQYKIIKRILSQFMPVDIAAKRSNIGVQMRRKLMNRIFAGVYPEIEIYIASECKETIRDFEFLKQAPEGGKFKEKTVDPSTGARYEKIGHVADAVEYLICEILKSYLKNID